MQTQASCDANPPCMRCNCLKKHSATHLQTSSKRLVWRTSNNSEQTDPDFAMQTSNTLTRQVLLEMRPVNFSAHKRARFTTRLAVHPRYVHMLGGHRIDDRQAGPKMRPQISTCERPLPSPATRKNRKLASPRHSSCNASAHLGHAFGPVPSHTTSSSIIPS